jgi:hypothetical protein
VHKSRFIVVVMGGSDGEPDGVVWMLVSPNNRQLGRSTSSYSTYSECRDAVMRLRAGTHRLTSQAMAVERTGQWVWWVDLDGVREAGSSRSYLRLRECTYNLGRFLAALPGAEVVTGARNVGPRRTRVGR